MAADVHKTNDPKGITYTSIVSRETVRISITYEYLNGLDIIAEDIHNAYLMVPTTNKNKFYLALDLDHRT